MSAAVSTAAKVDIGDDDNDANLQPSVFSISLSDSFLRSIITDSGHADERRCAPRWCADLTQACSEILAKDPRGFFPKIPEVLG
ncbi:hypothetical protein F2P81_019046 [Scophthalmus maximus]|uniref:Uncharacterized protein n=1 Tax=Scophthalmus maximus TaxID=52904 RepID=A0A6A4SFJ6_SCOMX|nr:hypothetical protein F2P81_019046 [Scophthalmus maximus]